MPWGTEVSKPLDLPPSRPRLLRRRSSWRRRGLDGTLSTGEIVVETHGRVRLHALRLSDFVVAVLCLWTFVAGLTQAESVTNASWASMANSTSASPTVGPESGQDQPANRPMESSLNKVFYSMLLFVLVPITAYLTATLIKIICPVEKTPGSFCCPKYQIGDSGEEATQNADVEKAGRDEKLVKNALLLLFTIDVNEEKEEEEELKEIEQAMKRLKERRLRKMRNMMRQQRFRIGAGVEDQVIAAFTPSGKEQPTAQDGSSESINVTEEDCMHTDSNPVENNESTHTTPNQEEREETTQMHTDPIANNPNGGVSVKENKPACNTPIENVPTPKQTVDGSGPASKTEPFENGGPSCAVANPPDSISKVSTEPSSVSNSTEEPVETSASRNTTNSSGCPVEIAEVKKPTRNSSTVSSSTVTLIQIHSERNDSTPTNKPPMEKSEPKEVVLKDKAKQTASLPVTDETIPKQKDENTKHINKSSPAKSNEPLNKNHQGSSKNRAHEMLPENKATAETQATTKSKATKKTGYKETYQERESTPASPTKQTVVADISKTDHVQTTTKLERVNIDSDVLSLRSFQSNTCSNSSDRVPRGKRKEEASAETEKGRQNTVPLKAILVQTVDID
ncbi:uncharacterized protein [Asterias amurensis]|uniref:uncharacterized protein n=1 Tax=Asterias amurensis TaxID=7602 RepID=UPI003AB7CDD1